MNAFGRCPSWVSRNQARVPDHLCEMVDIALAGFGQSTSRSLARELSSRTAIMGVSHDADYAVDVVAGHLGAAW